MSSCRFIQFFSWALLLNLSSRITRVFFFLHDLLFSASRFPFSFQLGVRCVSADGDSFTGTPGWLAAVEGASGTIPTPSSETTLSTYFQVKRVAILVTRIPLAKSALSLLLWLRDLFIADLPVVRL